MKRLPESEFLPSQLFSSDMDVSNSSLDEIDLEISRLYLWRTNREKYDSLPLGPLEHLKFAQDGRIFISDVPSNVYNKIGPLDKVVSKLVFHNPQWRIRFHCRWETRDGARPRRLLLDSGAVVQHISTSWLYGRPFFHRTAVVGLTIRRGNSLRLIALGAQM